MRNVGCRNRGGIVAVIVIGSLLVGAVLLGAGFWVGGRYRQSVYQQVSLCGSQLLLAHCC